MLGWMVHWSTLFPQRDVLDVAHVGLVGLRAAVGGGGAPVDTPSCAAPSSGVPAALPGRGPLFLEGLEAVGVGGPGLVLVDSTRGPLPHWAASSNGWPNGLD